MGEWKRKLSLSRIRCLILLWIAAATVSSLFYVWTPIRYQHPSPPMAPVRPIRNAEKWYEEHYDSKEDYDSALQEWENAQKKYEQDVRKWENGPKTVSVYRNGAWHLTWIILVCAVASVFTVFFWPQKTRKQESLELEFGGYVYFRSSKDPSGAPGEAEIQRLNPHRRELILNATGWADLFQGSLNVRVDSQVVNRLLLCEPVTREPGETVSYPSGKYEGVPKIRVGYLYYKAVLTHAGKKENVLVRRACNTTGLEEVVEVFAPKELHIKDGDHITCCIVSPNLP